MTCWAATSGPAWIGPARPRPMARPWNSTPRTLPRGWIMASCWSTTRTVCVMPPARGWTKPSKSIARPSGSLGRGIIWINLEVNLALALLFSERYAELEKLAARAEKSTAWRGFLVAAVAARQGVWMPITRRPRFPPTPTRGARSCKTRPSISSKRGSMPRPAAFYEAAAQGSAESGRTAGQGESLRRHAPHGRGGACPGSAAARGAAVVCRGTLRQQGPREDSRPVRQRGRCRATSRRPWKRSIGPFVRRWRRPARTRFRRCGSSTACCSRR